MFLMEKLLRKGLVFVLAMELVVRYVTEIEQLMRISIALVEKSSGFRKRDLLLN